MSAQANVCALAAPALADGQDKPKPIVTVVDRVLRWDDLHRALNNTDWSSLAHGAYRRFARKHFDPRQSVPGAPWSAWPLRDLLATMADDADVPEHLLDEVMGVTLGHLWRYCHQFDRHRGHTVLGWLRSVVRSGISATFKRKKTKENAVGQAALEFLVPDVAEVRDEADEVLAELLHAENALCARSLAATALLEATGRQAVAVEKAQAGQALSNADHQSLHRLRSKLAKKGLTAQYEQVMDPGWLPPPPATRREQNSNIGQSMVVPRQRPTPSRHHDLIVVAHAGPVR